MKSYIQRAITALGLVGLMATVNANTEGTRSAAVPLVGIHGAHAWPATTRARQRHWNRGLLGQRERIVYEHIDHQALTLYLFRPRGLAFRPRPVVIYVHGGALRYGSAVISGRQTPHNRLMVGVERQLMHEGVDFVSVNYRLAPMYPWPVPLEDVKHAVRFMELHAHPLHINGQRMAIMGDSAGGELSTFVGLTMSSAIQPERPVVAAVVDLFGPTNRRTFALQWRRRYGLSPNPVFGVYTWKAVRRESAVSYVHPGAPPFLIIQGTRDRIVPPGQSTLLKTRLLAHGVAVRELLVHRAGHELVAQHGPIRPGISVICQTIVQFLNRNLGVSDHALSQQKADRPAGGGRLTHEPERLLVR